MLQNWTEFLDSIPAGQPLRDVILDSWQRSIQAGITGAAAAFELPRVTASELHRRIEANRDMLEVAAPHLEWLSASLSNVPHCAYIVDADGIILQSRAVGIDLAASSLSPGFNWSESAAGTNGAGTAMAANRPVAIIGAEHIVQPFHGFTCTGAPLHDASGGVIGAIDLSTSVEDGRPERLLAVAHAAFVIDREISHRDKLAAANAATEARDRLLAEVSHEVRTPLTAILGWTQLIRSNPEMLDTALTEIESGAWRVSVLIADLFEMTRIATGKLSLERSRLDLADLVPEIVKTMQPLAVRSGIGLTTSLRRPATVFGDRKRMEQVLTNLLSNAIKFTPHGGSVSVAVESESDQVRLIVADTGCGIDEHLLPHVFDYLRQGSSVENSSGIGLGLSIVRNIVQLHGGSVSADSGGAGKGSTFTVSLPLLDDDPVVR